LLAAVPLFFASTHPRGLYHALLVGAGLLEWHFYKNPVFSSLLHVFSGLYVLIGLNAFTQPPSPIRIYNPEFSGFQTFLKYFWCVVFLITAIFLFAAPQKCLDLLYSEEKMSENTMAILWVCGVVFLYSIALLHHAQTKKSCMLFFALLGCGAALNVFWLHPGIGSLVAKMYPVLGIVTALLFQ
jgi:hypothetical protein